MHCFDSKLVRLKVIGPLGLQIPYLRFDSKLVRLKGLCTEAKEAVKAAFRFQIGAIKSLYGPYAKKRFRWGFDSKLVRLKGGKKSVRASGKNWFRFQIGAIKSPRAFLDNRRLQCFDSKLVRLKDN